MISDRTLRRALGSDSMVALIGDLVRVVMAIVVLVVIAWYFASYAARARDMFVALHMNDFGKFYYATRAFLGGGDLYAPNTASAMPVGGGATREFGNMNPPHFHLLMLPLARLEPLMAITLWTIVSLLALGLSLRVIAHELGWKWTVSRVIWTVLVVLVCAATDAVVVTGQVTFLFMLPITLAWAAARSQRWNKAAVFLGLVASVKPFLGVFVVYLILQRRTRAAMLMVATSVTCFILGLVTFGLAAHASWLQALRSVEWTWAVMNASVYGPLSRGLADNPFFTPLSQQPHLVQPLAMLSGLGIVIATFAAVGGRRGTDVDRSFGLLLLTALLAAPLGWVYYWWWLAGPIAAMWLSSFGSHSRTQTAFFLIALPGLLCPVHLTLAWQSQRWGGLTLGSIYFWTTVAIWSAAMLDRRVYLAGAK